ncbi:hypothetical protein GGI25_006012, partial [Coemansia spiralis]
MTNTKYAGLPQEILVLISRAADEKCLHALQHVNTLWRYLCLPLIWKSIEISEWEHTANPRELNMAYGRYVHVIEYRRHRRRRGHSHNAATPRASPTAIADGKTKTTILCEWLGMRWDNTRRVVVGAWPPYNVHRVQAAIAAACPRLNTLVLEGAADAWIDTLQHAVAAHPQLRCLHVTEDTRALLPPAADSPYKRLAIQVRFLADTAATQLTHLTVPCLADSVDQLLGRLSEVLPALKSLNLHQVDAGIANRLYINIPQGLKELKLSGRHPLSARMFCSCHTSSSGNLALATGHSNHRCDNSSQVQMLSAQLHSLSVTGLRSEEAARIENLQFWAAIFRYKWRLLSKLVVPIAHPEFGQLIEQNCPMLQELRILHAGSSIIPQENDQWV